jgi:hypothetical protein
LAAKLDEEGAGQVPAKDSIPRKGESREQVEGLVVLQHVAAYFTTRHQNWLGSSGGSLVGSSGGSLVVTPDCQPAVSGSNPAISPAYSGLPIFGWGAIWDGNSTVGCPLRGGRGE